MNLTKKKVEENESGVLQNRCLKTVGNLKKKQKKTTTSKEKCKVLANQFTWIERGKEENGGE